MVRAVPKYIFMDGYPVINADFLAQNAVQSVGVEPHTHPVVQTTERAISQEHIIIQGEEMDVLSESKYVFDSEGRPVINTQFLAQQHHETSNVGPSAPPAPQLTIVSTMQDQIAISQLTNLPTPPQFQATIATMQAPDFLSLFGVQDIEGSAIIDGLAEVFSQYEIPIGLMSKLIEFQSMAMHFKIDTSSSMKGASNLQLKDASEYMKRN